MKKLAFVSIVLVGLSLLANTALAFRLTPASLEVEVIRGHEQTEVLSIHNSNAKKSIFCRVYAVGFEVTKDGKPLFEEATQTYSAAGWIEPEESGFWIPSDSTKEVAVNISIPRNAKPGEYFAAVMASSTVQSRVKNSEGTEISMNVNLRLGCITQVTVPGRTATKKAEVSEVRVEVPAPGSEEQNIIVAAALVNKCKFHLDARGEVLIKDKKDRIFDKFVLQGAGKNARGEAFVFPQGSRDFWGIIQKPLLPGEYVAEVSFDYGYRSRRLRAETMFIVSKELGKQQKKFLVLTAEPNPIELEMIPGAFRTHCLKVADLDFEPLKVTASTQASWLKIKPSQFTVHHTRSKALRIEVSVPAGEPVERVGKILLTPERGKPITADVVVSEYKREEK